MTSTYGRLCAQFYDVSKPEAPPDALAFFLRGLGDASEPVLEPMCGSGRFLIPFLERDIEIDGVDSSPYMLQACHAHCDRKGLQPTLYQQRLEELELPRRYGYIFIPAGSFGLITDRAGARESLRHLLRHLIPGGEIIFEIETPRALPRAIGQWHEQRVTRPDGAEIAFSALPTYDRRKRVQHDIHNYSLYRDGHLVESEAEELSLRLYEPAEFRRLLGAAGFTGITATRSYQDAEPREEDAAIVFQCRRPQ